MKGTLEPQYAHPSFPLSRPWQILKVSSSAILLTESWYLVLDLSNVCVVPSWKYFKTTRGWDYNFSAMEVCPCCNPHFCHMSLGQFQWTTSVSSNTSFSAVWHVFLVRSSKNSMIQPKSPNTSNFPSPKNIQKPKKPPTKTPSVDLFPVISNIFQPYPLVH